MKLKEFFYLMGLRPAPQAYGYEVVRFDLPQEGRVEYARWLHPKEQRKTIEQSEVDELRRFLKAGDVAVDIGAHTGDTALPMALAVGPRGCVLALEPNKYVFPVLAKNAELNHDKTRILPLMIAATTADTELEFEYSDAGFCNGGRHEGLSRWQHGHAFNLTVQGRNLLALLRKDYADLLPRIRYLKVDAEGYDCTIIQSLASWLREQRPYLRAEVFSKSTTAQRQQLFQTVSDLGYDVYRIADRANYQGQKIGIAEMVAGAGFDIFCVPATKL